MRILFVHCNYPAQFRHLCSHFSTRPEHEVVFLCQNKEWTAGEVEGFNLARYQLGRDPQGQLCHPYLRRYETAVLHGHAALREALRLKQQGFIPLSDDGKYDDVKLGLRYKNKSGPIHNIIQ